MEMTSAAQGFLAVLSGKAGDLVVQFISHAGALLFLGFPIAVTPFFLFLAGLDLRWCAKRTLREVCFE